MKKLFAGMLVLMLCFVLAGCGSSINIVMKKGSLDFSMDLSPLAMNITKITITASNTSYGPQTLDLTLNGKVATGTMTLNEGSWNIRCDIFDGSPMPVFTGEQSIAIISGQTQNVQFTFDENTTPSSGTVNFQIVINDFAQHKIIPQWVDDIAVTPAGDTYYLLDAMQRKIGVYDMMFNQMQKFSLPDTPNCMTLSNDGLSLFLGFMSGHVLKLDIMSGTMTSILSVPGTVENIVATGLNTILIRWYNGFEHNFRLVDSNTGAFISQLNIALNGAQPGKMVFNHMKSNVYFTAIGQAGGVMPSAIYSIHIDQTNNMLFKKVDCPESDLQPLKFLQNENLLVTSAGNLYTCSSTDMDDLIQVGSIGTQYRDILQITDKVYAINKYDANGGIFDPAQVKLMVMDSNNYFVWKSIQLEGKPRYIYSHMDNELIFLVEKDGNWYFHKKALPL